MTGEDKTRVRKARRIEGRWSTGHGGCGLEAAWFAQSRIDNTPHPAYVNQLNNGDGVKREV